MSGENAGNPWLCIIDAFWQLLKPDQWVEYSIWFFNSAILPETEIEDIDALVLGLTGQVYIRGVKFIVGWKSKAARCADPRVPAGLPSFMWQDVRK